MRLTTRLNRDGDTGVGGGWMEGTREDDKENPRDRRWDEVLLLLGVDSVVVIVIEDDEEREDWSVWAGGRGRGRTGEAGERMVPH